MGEPNLSFTMGLQKKKNCSWCHVKYLTIFGLIWNTHVEYLSPHPFRLEMDKRWVIPWYITLKSKSSVTFLVLQRNLSLYHLKAYLYGFILAVALNIWVPPSWPKMALNPKKDLKLTKNQFLTMKSVPKNLEPPLKKSQIVKLSDDINKKFPWQVQEKWQSF